MATNAQGDLLDGLWIIPHLGDEGAVYVDEEDYLRENAQAKNGGEYYIPAHMLRQTLAQIYSVQSSHSKALDQLDVKGIDTLLNAHAIDDSYRVAQTVDGVTISISDERWHQSLTRGSVQCGLTLMWRGIITTSLPDIESVGQLLREVESKVKQLGWPSESLIDIAYAHKGMFDIDTVPLGQLTGEFEQVRAANHDAAAATDGDSELRQRDEETVDTREFPRAATVSPEELFTDDELAEMKAEVESEPVNHRDEYSPFSAREGWICDDDGNLSNPDHEHERWKRNEEAFDRWQEKRQRQEEREAAREIRDHQVETSWDVLFPSIAGAVAVFSLSIPLYLIGVNQIVTSEDKSRDPIDIFLPAFLAAICCYYVVKRKRTKSILRELRMKGKAVKVVDGKSAKGDAPS
ncbi:MAG: hypothetical protein ABIS50_09375 [Luteolibacter sp.]|uniref:hypothetical protein n=1 Tax=Luteolibacter sp. TaxID=1962973 RepID=UPI003265626D